MYTIYDYLKYYKDFDLKDLSWNIMDNLLCAIIAYIPLESFDYSKNFDIICEEVTTKNLYSNSSVMAQKTIEIFSLLKNSKRYKEMTFNKFINVINDKTQFGVITCSIKNIKVISFKGTDGSVIGWLENFRLAYLYPTYTQELAIKYLNENISIFDKNVYVIGHSKGGNLAMCSAMELDNLKYSKIQQIINFDGPGFRKNEYDSLKFKRICNKLINIIPTNSYIGVLLFNKEYKTITSNAVGINVHYPTSWNCYGSFLIDGELSSLSKQLHESTSSNISNLNDDKIKDIFENAFKTLEDKKTSKVNLTFNDIVNLFKSVKGLDQNTSKYLFTIINSMLNISNLEAGKKDNISNAKGNL